MFFYSYRMKIVDIDFNEPSVQVMQDKWTQSHMVISTYRQTEDHEGRCWSTQPRLVKREGQRVLKFGIPMSQVGPQRSREIPHLDLHYILWQTVKKAPRTIPHPMQQYGLFANPAIEASSPLPKRGGGMALHAHPPLHSRLDVLANRFYWTFHRSQPIHLDARI